MTDLTNGSMLELLPPEMRQDTETIAFAYAVDRQITKLCAYAEQTQIYASIDNMPEWLLDILAVELRTPAYQETYSIAVKRTLVKQTLPFWEKMGTPAAVNRIIEAIFGSGEIEEFWEYGGEPHHFRARTGNPYITAENVAEFKQALESVKRLSSWLDEVTMNTSAETYTQYMGFWCSIGEIVRTPVAEL